MNRSGKIYRGGEGGGTLKINGARGQRGRSRWFDVPTVFTRKQTRECCHFEIFPKILNVVSQIRAKWRVIRFYSIISLSPFFISLETLFLQFEKNVTREIARFPSPFFPRLKERMESMARHAVFRDSAALRDAYLQLHGAEIEAARSNAGRGETY